MPFFPRVRGTRLEVLGELASVLQERCLRLSPRQYLPPMVGLGLSQCRLEEDTPPPHVRLQSPHGVHGPQAPSTPSGLDPKGTQTRL